MLNINRRFELNYWFRYIFTNIIMWFECPSWHVQEIFWEKLVPNFHYLLLLSYCNWACKFRPLPLSLLHGMQINDTRFNEVVWKYSSDYVGDTIRMFYTHIFFRWMHYGYEFHEYSQAGSFYMCSELASQSVDETLGLTFTWHLEESANVLCPEPNHKNVSLLAF